jgi:hypothetical protein
MTVLEFHAWIDGYMIDRDKPDAAVIAEKAREIVAAVPFELTWYPWWGIYPPWPSPQPFTPYQYWTIDTPTITSPGGPNTNGGTFTNPVVSDTVQCVYDYTLEQDRWQQAAAESYWGLESRN